MVVYVYCCNYSHGRHHTMTIALLHCRRFTAANGSGYGTFPLHAIRTNLNICNSVISIKIVHEVHTKR